MKYEASEPDSFHRTLDAAMAKGRLVSTRDALARSLCDWTEGQPCENCVDMADAMFARGVVQTPAEFVTTLADDERVLDAVCRAFYDAAGAPWDSLSAYNQRQGRRCHTATLRALAAHLTERAQ